jgi:hypothetical protein
LIISAYIVYLFVVESIIDIRGPSSIFFSFYYYGDITDSVLTSVVVTLKIVHKNTSFNKIQTFYL